MFARFLNAKFIPTSQDLGLLFLRVGIGMILFSKHGWEKLAMLRQGNPGFPDLIHIGSTPTLLIATFSDGICTLLMVVGFGTRWAALCSFSTLFVAWAFKHHFAFFGTMRDAKTWTIDSVFGEIITQLLVVCLVLMVTGPGRYSIDALLDRKDSATASKS